MITFVQGEVELGNCKVDLNEVRYDGSYSRDEEGNVTVVLDAIPYDGDKVVLQMTECRSTYVGSIQLDGEIGVFIKE